MVAKGERDFINTERKRENQGQTEEKKDMMQEREEKERRE